MYVSGVFEDAERFKTDSVMSYKKQKLSTKELDGERKLINGKPTLFLKTGVSGVMKTWKPKEIFSIQTQSK